MARMLSVDAVSYCPHAGPCGQIRSASCATMLGMVQTSARLLALLSLLQQRREWSGPELAGRLEVGPRTIRRDVEKLRQLGYPIEAAPGIAGGYRLAAGAQMPPLLLDDAEAIAVAVGLRSAASGSISGIEEYSVRALAKLEQILPERLRDRVRAPAEVIGNRVPTRYATVAPDGPDACIVTTTGRWSREFLVWMAMMDAELEVLEPPELAAEAGRIATRLAHVAA